VNVANESWHLPASRIDCEENHCFGTMNTTPSRNPINFGPTVNHRTATTPTAQVSRTSRCICQIFQRQLAAASRYLFRPHPTLSFCRPRNVHAGYPACACLDLETCYHPLSSCCSIHLFIWVPAGRRRQYLVLTDGQKFSSSRWSC